MPDFRTKTIDGKPCTDWKAIYKEAAKHLQSIITVKKYDPEKEVSDKQMAYLHAVVFPTFAGEYHCSVLWAEITLKRCCGEQWMVKRVEKTELILSKTILSVKQCNQWIENIWDWCGSHGIHIPQPDKDWRERK